MNTSVILKQILEGSMPSSTTIQQMSNEDTLALVDCLKGEADRHWHIDPKVSLHCGQSIIQIGDIKQDDAIIALGTMACGDALRNLHQIQEAWETLDSAGDTYLDANDKVGWARTRIGKLAICFELNETETALSDAQKARDIFLEANNLEKLLRLEVNVALVLNYQSEFAAAIEQIHAVRRLIESIGEVDSHRLVFVYYNLGYAHKGLGNLREALYWYGETRNLMEQHGEERGIMGVNLHIINILHALGHNKKALLLLHDTEKRLEAQGTLETNEMWHVIECYLYFRRFDDALRLARKVVEQYTPDDNSYLFALALLQLATVEMAVDNFSKALDALRHSEQIFEQLDAEAWLGLVHLYRGQVAMRHGDFDLARYAAKEAVDRLREHQQQTYYLMALLLSIHTEINSGSLDVPIQTAQTVQKMARDLQIPHIRYEAHVLLGKMAEQSGRLKRAERHYQVATGIIEQIQRSLVLTARTDFLANRQESVQSLLRLHFRAGNVESAFTTLERTKAQIWLEYLSQLDHLRWFGSDPEISSLIDDLTRLREEHYWYYRVAHDQMFREKQQISMTPAAAIEETDTRERQIRVLVEQLYLQSNIENLSGIKPVSIADIQTHLGSDRKMIAYYDDGENLSAFLLDGKRLHVFPLPKPVRVIKQLLDKWQSNIKRALRTSPGSSDEKVLARYARSIAAKLYDALIAPFANHLKNCQRLYIIPYGSLHYLPFHLLHDQTAYLLEQFEIVILPVASLITQSPPQQPYGARSIAYSWDGRLQYSEMEAQSVVKHFGGELYSGQQADKNVFNSDPCQVLHISAHGHYRMDKPNFSYIQLADGPLFADDLFQFDLRYELVTLSACETGRSHVAAGDELIGLGRSFLFAGAGALISSLWQVDEGLTLELMDHLYSQLDTGESKIEALRNAQLAVMETYPGLHPAFWGAFELVGNADPLTRTQQKEYRKD